MRPRPFTLLAALPLIGLPAWAFAQDVPDVQKILKKADAATKAVVAVSYDTEFKGTGDLAQRLPVLRGVVKGRKIRRFVFRTGKTKHEWRLTGVRIQPDSETEIPFDVAAAGKYVVKIDIERKTYTTGKRSQAEELIGPIRNLPLMEFFHPTPFSDEINAKKAEYEGVKEIEGVPCDVVYVHYQNEGYQSRWFFGREDSLPRRVERYYKRKGVEGARVWTLSNINTSPQFTKRDFYPRCPPGFKKCKHVKPDELLPVGAPAPAFKLKSTGGEIVSLKGSRGHVLVLDFYATWCQPCRMAMPGLQRLHRRYEGKPVKIIGISCAEKERDPVEYFKSKGYTYTQIINGESVADLYHVSNLPTFYVIDPQGRVVHTATGFVRHYEEKLTKIIDKALKKGDAPPKRKRPARKSRERTPRKNKVRR